LAASQPRPQMEACAHMVSRWLSSWLCHWVTSHMDRCLVLTMFTLVLCLMEFELVPNCILLQSETTCEATSPGHLTDNPRRSPHRNLCSFVHLQVIDLKLVLNASTCLLCCWWHINWHGNNAYLAYVGVQLLYKNIFCKFYLGPNCCM